MRLDKVEVENFRSIRRLVCNFDSVTTFVGPNGAGKSTILRALDWVFNAPKGVLTPDDRHLGSTELNAPVRVRVDFTELTPQDRKTLGAKYCPDGATTFSIWRTWSDGDEKLTGKALAFLPFEFVRGQVSAMGRRGAYNELRNEHPEYDLPPCSSVAAVDEAMDNWERLHPEALSESEISDTHLFGFNGQGVIAELFDFVFVSGDLRAAAETEDTKTSIFGRILQRAIDRSGLDMASSDLTRKYEEELAQLSDQHLSEQLDEISKAITAEISTFTRGRSVTLATARTSLKPQPSRVEVQVTDGHITTPVTYQGHGFQRTMLLAALTVLSRRGRRPGAASQMFLAIEEPELFQHPTQAKALASVLRALADDESQSVQVAYATHSPHFVESRCFDQVRRVTSRHIAGAISAETKITTASIDAACEKLKGYIDPGNIVRRWDQVCLRYLPEALFADSVILVEGDEDAAILEAAGEVNQLAVGGTCVAPVCGKTNMIIPFTILSILGINSLMVVDNDSGCGERMRANNRTEQQIHEAEEKHKKDNRLLCRYVNAAEEDYPVGEVSRSLVFVPDTLETLLASDLPGWDLTRARLIKEGRGVDGKNAATFALATRECRDTPGETLAGLLNLVRLRAA
jgi:putative ATP-dependent endonuclease of OLD family